MSLLALMRVRGGAHVRRSATSLLSKHHLHHHHQNGQRVVNGLASLCSNFTTLTPPALAQQSPHFSWDPILPPVHTPGDDGFDLDDDDDDDGYEYATDLDGDDDDVDGDDGVGDGVEGGSSSVKPKKPRPDGTYGFKGGRKRARAYAVFKPAVSGVAEPLFLVNGKPLADYFGSMDARRAAAAPVVLTSTHADFVIRASVSGGGMQGQAEAVRNAVALGIRFFKPEYRRLLRAAGYVTRDRRVVETKKPGRRKARKVKTKPYR